MFRTTPHTLPFAQLRPSFEGDLYFDESPEHTAQRKLYATDASVYQELPVAVALPRSVEDIKRLVRFAKQHNRPDAPIGLIPRAAGTSLAGQVVGNGIVVDISKYFDKIVELNVAEQWVRVQPGVIRDDLNAFLRPHGLMFGPETSTASRAMIGGMIGNNSCGLHSIVWGSTRDHLIEARVVLTDGAEITLGPLTQEQFEAKCNGQNIVSPLEQQLYAQTQTWLSDPQTRQQIRDGFPKPTVTRRNTGYALDALLHPSPDPSPLGRGENFSEATPLPNGEGLGEGFLSFCPLIAGSEGTLCFITEAKLNLLPLPPTETALVCAHFETVRDSLRANLIALAHGCQASELVDDYILQLTKTNTEQAKNRTFVVGEPKAVLMVEFFDHDHEGVARQAELFVEALKNAGLGYAYPTLYNDDTKKPWALRKAGLSIMYNVPGDEQPVNLIEDCAVSPEDLPDYIEDLETLARDKYGLRLEYSAHAGAGELHVLPLINLKTTAGRQVFRNLLADTALLVKKYGGSLSGEHGDGRLRGEFIPTMVGAENFALMRRVKQLWDPAGIFNPGKIIDTPPMNTMLRTEADTPIPQPQTLFDFSKDGGLLHLAEKCSGSGDCRKTHVSGGTMCLHGHPARTRHHPRPCQHPSAVL
jgi:FAD/FMN-containing dehydrogenase